jgi:hypothetical protein
VTLADAASGRRRPDRSHSGAGFTRHSTPPVPPRRVPSSRSAAARSSARGRPSRPAGPLVARRDVAEQRAARVLVRRNPSRVRRFADRYGWCAYAIPLLTIATVAVLVDLVVRTPTAPAEAAGTATEAPAPAPATAAAPTPARPTLAELDAGPSDPPPAAAGSYVERGAGTVTVVDGSSQVYGRGQLRRFVVEVEDGIQVDGAGFARAVEQTLSDPRSWGHGGQMSFQRVGAAQAAARQYDFKVTLVSPGNMETYCPGVGTGGYTSCRYGERAVINLARWATAVPDYQGDIATYRQYVVNHEVGHALGQGHQPCPGAGQVAPVMQQQTLGLKGCRKNAWPYP